MERWFFTMISGKELRELEKGKMCKFCKKR